MAARKLAFYDHHRMNWHEPNWHIATGGRNSIKGEFMIGDFLKGDPGGVGKGGEFKIVLYDFRQGYDDRDEGLSPQFCVFTDGLLSFNTLAKMGVVEKIRRATIMSRDDLSWLLMANGVRDDSDVKLL